MDIDQLKSQIVSEVDNHRDELFALSRKIHDNPEEGFQEFKAAGWLTDFLEEHGFSVERGICGLPTAFRASYGQGGPIIALMAEYDALPDMGHGCGHNLIAAAGAGAGIASRPAVDHCAGQVTVIGTPAEELYGGKVSMAEKGAFADLDVAMMVHPGGHDAAFTEAMACQGLSVEFFGKASHAASRPEAGINALEALIQSYNSLNSLRQHIKSKARIHGIITDGGQASNVVPDHSAGSFLVRAADENDLAELKSRVLNCFIGAATATGARLEYKWDERCYAPMLNNLHLARLFIRNMKQVGRKMKMVEPAKSFGSTDFGNVSQLVPGIHPSVAITPHRGVVSHSPQFAEAAISEKGLEAMLEAAKAMAMTAADLLADPALLTGVKNEFLRHR